MADLEDRLLATKGVELLSKGATLFFCFIPYVKVNFLLIFLGFLALFLMFCEKKL